MFCFSKEKVWCGGWRRVPWWTGCPVAGFWKGKEKKVFKSISKLLSWERCLLQKKNVCKTTPAWKSAFAANQLSPTDSMHIFPKPCSWVKVGLRVQKYSLDNLCCFLEKKIRSSKGYACTRLACGSLGRCDASTTYIGLRARSPHMVFLHRLCRGPTLKVVRHVGSVTSDV